METVRLPKQAFLSLKTLDANGKYNWVTQLRLFLGRCGFGHVWMWQGVGDEKVFLAALRQRLLDMNLQDWTAGLNSSDRYLYRSFKSPG